MRYFLHRNLNNLLYVFFVCCLFLFKLKKKSRVRTSEIIQNAPLSTKMQKKLLMLYSFCFVIGETNCTLHFGVNSIDFLFFLEKKTENYLLLNLHLCVCVCVCLCIIKSTCHDHFVICCCSSFFSFVLSNEITQFDQRYKLARASFTIFFFHKYIFFSSKFHSFVHLNIPNFIHNSFKYSKCSNLIL